jgi:hypothetical protein
LRGKRRDLEKRRRRRRKKTGSEEKHNKWQLVW